MSRLLVSACLVVRDGEDVIGDAIRSVGFVAEIVLVVDARTSDRTVEVARAAADPSQIINVVHHEWMGHVAQKALAVEKASEDWVLCLDADERISDELRRQIEGVLENSPRHQGYAFARRTYYLGRWIRHGGWYPDRKLRLFRRESGRWGGVDPHDRVILDGSAGRLRGDILHRSHTSIGDHLRAIDSYAGIAARQMKARGVGWPVARMLIHPTAKFLKMYLFRRGILDGFAGMVVAGLGSFSVFLKYARLWEMIETERRARQSGAVPLDT